MNVNLTEKELEMLSEMVGFEIEDEEDVHEAIRIIHDVAM